MKRHYIVSLDPASLEHLRTELRESPNSMFCEGLDEHRNLCQLSEDFQGLFELHRFPVQCQLDLPDFSLTQVEHAAWSELDFTPMFSEPYGIQLAANRRLPWSFAELVPRWIERLALPQEGFQPRAPQVVLSAYLHQTEQACRLFAGVSRVEENLSPWASGHCRIPRDPDSVSRAEAKLLEAWEAFGVRLQPSGTALDLGAAPGGWTRVLHAMGYRVVAVDPAALDPRVSALSAVTHRRETAGTYFQRNKARRFDLLVSDMKMDAQRAAQLLVDCVSCLGEDGQLLTTLKLGRGAGTPREARAALDILATAYQVKAARQLYFNRSEITVYAVARSNLS